MHLLKQIEFGPQMLMEIDETQENHFQGNTVAQKSNEIKNKKDWREKEPLWIRYWIYLVLEADEFYSTQDGICSTTLHFGC